MTHEKYMKIQKIYNNWKNQLLVQQLREDCQSASRDRKETLNVISVARLFLHRYINTSTERQMVTDLNQAEN